MSPRTTTRPRGPDHARSLLRGTRPVQLIGAVAAVSMLLALTQLFDQPAYVTRMTFENPTAYDLHIDVADADRDGWMPVSRARRHGTTVAEEIYDIGDVWVFRVAAQGEQGGEFRLTRSQLDARGWRVAVPASVGAQLRDRGAPLPP